MVLARMRSGPWPKFDIVRDQFPRWDLSAKERGLHRCMFASDYVVTIMNRDIRNTKDKKYSSPKGGNGQ